MEFPENTKIEITEILVKPIAAITRINYNKFLIYQ